MGNFFSSKNARLREISDDLDRRWGWTTEEAKRTSDGRHTIHKNMHHISTFA